jgi:hypothetical protein
MVSKRSAAIVGPTPETLYWAIEHPCPWRKPLDKSLAMGAFRDLRTLRELSLAIAENRIESGIALHPRTRQNDGSAVLGFVVAEVEQTYGGRDYIEHSCGSCPANSAKANGGWAGCYGWLPLWRSDAADDFTESEFYKPHLLHHLVDQAIFQTVSQTEFSRIFMPTKLGWYGMWIKTPWNSEQITLGLKILREVLQEPRTTSPEFQTPSPLNGERTIEENLVALIDALILAADANLPIHFELCPAGFSDGATWSLPSHCGRCRAQRTEKICPTCGIHGDLQPARRRRVLGLRPYLRLAEIIGAEATEELAARYRNRAESMKDGL